MATFLKTAAINQELENLVAKAEKRLDLVSPYLQIGQRIQDLLLERSNRGVEIHVVYRENKLTPDEERTLRALRTIHLHPCANLHAKCYANDDCAILTSMNLYQHSQTHNEEMGILVSRHTASDESLFREVTENISRLIRTSELRHSAGAAAASSPRLPVPDQERLSAAAAGQGYCIRCAQSIAFNLEKPLCKADYAKWKAYENADYEEKYCHRCGKPHATSINKPLCRECYKLAK